MKKIINILYFLLMIFLFYFTKDSNMLLFTMSFSMFIIFSSLFSSTSINDKINKFNNNKYYYSSKKIFKYTIIFISIIISILILISYLFSLLINIKDITLVNICMCIYLYTNIIMKIEGEYINNKIINIYNIINIILVFISIILLYKVFHFDNYINICILYLINIINFIFFNIMFYIFIFRKNKYVKKREENKINYIREAKNCLITNKINTIFNIIKSSYIYFSIIILYFILINKYNYSYDTISNYITSIYLYGIGVIYFIYKIINNIYIDSFNELKNKIINKNEYNIYNFINKIINITISLMVLLIIISKPINNILFNGSTINIILDVSYLLFFYIFYEVIININMICNKEKNVIIILLIGLVISLITIIPIINSSYRMGYNLVSGSIMSIILGITISTIIGIILIRNKLKLSLLDNFNNILNIIYSNIIYTLILVLFTFIIKVDIDKIFNSILVIIFYIFISIVFYIIKKKLINKRVQ